MKSRIAVMNRSTTPKAQQPRFSGNPQSSLRQTHSKAMAYARARMNNAAIHDRAPRATARTRIGILSDPHHRDPSGWSSIRTQLQRILHEHGGRGAEAVTLLAATTDRLFAMIAQDLGMPLSLVIPSRDFHNFFNTPDDLSEYVHLRTIAHSRTVLERPTFNRQAFEEASRLVVDTCDIIIAVGSGFAPSNAHASSDIIQYARERAKLLVWLDPEARAPSPRMHIVR